MWFPYGTGAIVNAFPRMLDSGETYRWEIEIDGAPELARAKASFRQVRPTECY